VTFRFPVLLLIALIALTSAQALRAAERLALFSERAELPAFLAAPGLPVNGWMVLGPLTEDVPPANAAPANGAPAGSLPAFLAPAPASAPAPDGRPEIDWRPPVWIGAEPFVWFPMAADSMGHFHPHGALGPVPRGDVVYLYRVVRSPRQTSTILALTGGGGVTAWCNGVRLDPIAGGTDRERFFHAPLVRGPNALLVRHVAPPLDQPWFLMAQFADTPTTTPALAAPMLPARQILLAGSPGAPVGPAPPLPAGWKRQQAPVAAVKGRNHPYLLFAPIRPETSKPGNGKSGEKDRPAAKTSPVPAPLLIVAEPAEPDEERLVLYEDRLTTAACQTGWAVAVLTQPIEQNAGYGTAEAIEAVRRDAATRLNTAPRRVALVALGDTAEDALTVALAQPAVYAGVGVLEGRWRDQESWTRTLMGCAPRPAIYLAAAPGAVGDPIEEVQADLAAEDGQWVRRTIEPGKEALITRDLLDTFLAAPLPQSPPRIVLAGYAPPPRRFAWVRLERPLDAALPAYLSAELATTNTLNIQAENVARFDLAWKTLPALNPARPITLVVDSPDGQQKINLLGPALPPVFALSLVQKNEQTVVWEARDAEAVAKATPRPGEPRLENAGPVRLQIDLPARSDADRAGLAQWMARAAREEGHAAVGIVPARVARSGRNRGELALADWAPCCFDARLSTVTLPASFLLRVIENDFAGPRLLATDGIDGMADEETRRDRVFASSTLEALGQGPVVVAGTRSLLEQLAQLLLGNPAPGRTPAPTPGAAGPGASAGTGNAPAPASGTPGVPGSAPLFDLLVSQRGALLRHLEAHPTIDKTGTPDLRCPPRKTTPEIKRKTQ
jgi:hypothetical protein